MDAIIQSSFDSQKQLEELPTYQLAEGLLQISHSVKQRKEELAKIIVRESKKPLRYALAEVDRAVQTFLIASEECKRNQGEYLSIDWTPKGKNKQALVKKFPVGVVLGITPFNFPLNLVAHKVAPAIASRNSIIIKPSPKTPECAKALLAIVQETSLPKNTLQVVEWSNENTVKAVSHEKIDFVSFTGSDQVGWLIKEKAGKNKIALELGSNASLIITPTANIENAISKSIIGAFAYSGQVCIHTQILYIHESIYNQFTTKFINKTKQLNAGNPNLESTEIASMIDEKSAIRVEKWVNEAVSDGANILLGGKRKEDYYPPTILENTNSKMKVIAEEIFGPVVSFIPYKNIGEVINQINNSKYGLQTGIFSDSQKEINNSFTKLKIGGLIVNDTPTFRVDHMPYGGEKNSGFGREGVRYAMDEMSYLKTLVY